MPASEKRSLCVEHGGRRSAGKGGGESVVWKAHTLLSGRERDVRLVPTTATRREGWVL